MVEKMKVIILSGLPASGKSFWARCHAYDNPKDGWKIISRDDIRETFAPGKWSRAREKIVVTKRDEAIRDCLNLGNNIIVDETFVNPKQLEHVKRICAEYGAEIIEKPITTPLQECIRRDLNRGERAVGAGVIREHARKRAEKPEKLPDAADIYICDVDGTLAITPPGASHYERDFTLDIPNWPVVDLVQFLKQNSYVPLFLVSGRKERFRQQTEKWLENIAFQYDELYMRPDDTNEKDYIIKRRIYDQYIRGQYNVLGVFDDRDQTVDEWRQLGLPTFQVADGGF